MSCLLILVAVAGCLDVQEPQDPDDEEVLPVEPTYPFLPPRTQGVTLPNVTYPNFQVRGCTSLSTGLLVPINLVDAVVPEEFHVRSAYAPTLTGITLRTQQCDDSLNHESVFGKTYSYMALASVHPGNESWAEPNSINFYILDVAIDNQDFIDAFREVHLQPDPADFTITNLDIADEIFQANLKVDAGEWWVETNFRYIPNHHQELGHETHIWYGDGPFHRFHEATAYESEAYVDQGYFEFGGDSVLSSVLQTPVFPSHSGSWRTDMNTLYQYDGAWFIE
jgi:hypothetical protein